MADRALQADEAQRLRWLAGRPSQGVQIARALADALRGRGDHLAMTGLFGGGALPLRPQPAR